MSAGSPDFWTVSTSVFFTSLWDWDPETWGAIGFTNDGGRTRRENLLSKLTDPFIAVVYVTSNRTYIDAALKGMIAGFYLVSHEKGDRDNFTHPIHFNLSPEKWRHSLRAVRAFSYLPESRLSVRDFDIHIIRRARAVARMGEIITDPAKIALLKNTPWIEVDVYKPASVVAELSVADDTRHGMVPGGPASAEGYVVANGSLLTARELYVLRLEGDTDAYLGRPASGRVIIKVGLAASPDMRRQTFQKAMPRGAFQWKIDRTTSTQGLPNYPNHAVAVKGEDAMKRHLVAHAEWLGGEFYLASEEVIEAAWQLGCDMAQRNMV